MRDRRQLELSPDEYRDALAQERRRNLAIALDMLRRAWERREPWYMWVLERGDREARLCARDDDDEPAGGPSAFVAPRLHEAEHRELTLL